MKKRMLSLVAAMALLLTTMPMVFTATAGTADELTAGLKTLVVQNFEL